MSNGDLGYWTGSINYAPSWSATPYVVNFGKTDYSFTGTAPSTGYSGALAAYSPINSWELNGSAADEINSATNGTPTAVSFGNASTGIAGQTSASFNGTSSYVSTPVNPSGYTQFTISVWVNLNGLSQTGSPRIFANSNGANQGFELGLAGGSFAPFVRIGNGSANGTVIAGSPIASTGWVHLVGTWNGTTVALYSNGALLLTASLSGGTLSTGANNVYIGQNPGDGGNFFNGLIQGAALLPVGLTAAQVSQLYAASSTPQSSGVGGVDWLWMAIQGWDSPPTSGSVVQRASDHGGWPTDQFFAPRTMTLTVHASAPTQAARDQARAELQAAIPVNDLAMLTYNEPVPKQALVRRSGQVVETYSDLTDVEFSCVLVAPDPRKYTTSVKALQTTAPPSSFGLNIPANFTTSRAPFSIGSHSTAAATTCVFTLTAAVPVGGGVVVSMVCPNATAQTVSAADSKGNTYTLVTQAVQGTAPAESVFTLAAPVTTALTTADTLTVTTTNSQIMSTEGVGYSFYSGVDTFNSAIGVSATPSIANVSPATANSSNLVFFGNNATKTATVPADGRGWTQFTNVTTGSLSLDAFAVANVSNGSITAASTYSGSTSWAATYLVVDTAPPTVPYTVFTELNFNVPVGVTSWNISTPSPGVQNGLTLYVQVAGPNVSVNTLTITDPRGNSYFLVSSVANASSSATMFQALYASKIVSPLQPSDNVNIAGATNANYMSTMWSGNPSLPTGNTATNFGTGTTASLTINGVSGDVVVGMPGSLGAATLPAGWTQISNNFGNGFNNDVCYQVPAGSSASMSSTVNSPWLALAAAYLLPPTTVLPAMTLGGSVTVTNSGNFETRPIVTVTGPITGPTITLDGTQTISFSNITLAAGDKLVLNTDSKTAMLNGSYRPSDISSSWWVLQPGPHTVQLGGITTGGATLQVTYQDAWI